MEYVFFWCCEMHVCILPQVSLGSVHRPSGASPPRPPRGVPPPCAAVPRSPFPPPPLPRASPDRWLTPPPTVVIDKGNATRPVVNHPIVNVPNNRTTLSANRRSSNSAVPMFFLGGKAKETTGGQTEGRRPIDFRRDPSGAMDAPPPRPAGLLASGRTTRRPSGTRSPTWRRPSNRCRPHGGNPPRKPVVAQERRR